MQNGIRFNVLFCGEAGLKFRQGTCPILRAAEDPVSRIPFLINEGFDDRFETHEKGGSS
jgi:hypothetical protein